MRAERVTSATEIAFHSAKMHPTLTVPDHCVCTALLPVEFLVL